MRRFELTDEQVEELLFHAQSLREESSYDTSGESYYDGLHNGYIDGVRYVLNTLGLEYVIPEDSFEEEEEED
jgi:hypothetical protein